MGAEIQGYSRMLSPAATKSVLTFNPPEIALCGHTGKKTIRIYIRLGRYIPVQCQAPWGLDFQWDKNSPLAEDEEVSFLA